MDLIEIKPIAYIHTDFPEKFGIPRQSGIVPQLKGTIEFEPEFIDPNAVREMDKYSHLWLIWGFSENKEKQWSPTVRPPRLGGNVRVGVFASRSPVRPNPLGLTVVKIEKVEIVAGKGPVITVSGADIMDNSPIYDIKPYLPYVDSVPDASDGFALAQKEGVLRVDFPEELISKIPVDKREGLIKVLSQDPRPQYKEDGDRIYKMSFADLTVSFTVQNSLLKVLNVE